MAHVYKGHYNNNYLINALDKNNEKPAFFIVCSRERGPGKTFSFSKLLYNNFVERGEKFILLTRNMGDLGNVAEGVLSGYMSFEHPDVNVYEKIQMKGVFSKIYATSGTGEEVKTEHIGYVIPVRAADQIKKISSLFYDASAFYFDEFQPMNQGSYLKNEVDLLYNIYKSIARGDGSAIRYMPIYMASNTIDLHNPYFKALGLTKAIQSNTRFYRGEGVVFENVVVEGLSEAHASSPIDRALSKHLEEKTNSNLWLNDANSLVCKPDDWGNSSYICTLVYNKEKLAIYKYYEMGLYYVNRKIDNNCKYIYNTSLDGNLNLPMLKNTPVMLKLKESFFKGLIRCSDGGVQNILLDIFT